MELDPYRRRHQLVYQVGFGVSLLVLWIVAGAIWPRVFPYPWLIVDAFGQQVSTGEMGEAVYYALQAIVLGYLLAVIVGISVGLAMGLSEVAEEFFDPYLDALYAMPFAALIPAMIIWFGTGLRIRVVVVFFFAVFPITINTLEGARSIPAAYTELTQSFGADGLYFVRNIVIPYELPYILAGLRLGSGLAVRGLVVTELLVSVTGFGELITKWSAAFRMEGVVSVVLVLMFLGISSTWLLHQAEERLIAWDVSVVES